MYTRAATPDTANNSIPEIICKTNNDNDKKNGVGNAMPAPQI